MADFFATLVCIVIMVIVVIGAVWLFLRTPKNPVTSDALPPRRTTPAATPDAGASTVDVVDRPDEVIDGLPTIQELTLAEAAALLRPDIWYYAGASDCVLRVTKYTNSNLGATHVVERIAGKLFVGIFDPLNQGGVMLDVEVLTLRDDEAFSARLRRRGRLVGGWPMVDSAVEEGYTASGISLRDTAYRAFRKQLIEARPRYNPGE